MTKKVLIFSSLIFLQACVTKPSTLREDGSVVASESTPTAKSNIEPLETNLSKSEEPIRPQSSNNLNVNELQEAIRSQGVENIKAVAEKTLEHNPSNLQAMNALAMAYYKKGQFEVSRFLLQKGISASPKRYEFHSNMGLVLLSLNERKEAIKSFRKAIELNPADTIALSNLGSIYVAGKDYSKAATVLEMAVKKGQSDIIILSNFAIALAGTGKFEKGKEVYKTLMKNSEAANVKEVLFNQAILLIDNLGQFQEGLEILDRLKFVGGPANSRNKIIALENKAKTGLK